MRFALLRSGLRLAETGRSLIPLTTRLGPRPVSGPPVTLWYRVAGCVRGLANRGLGKIMGV